MEHHSIYDSTTSQHKNFTKTEVVTARSRLYAHVQNLTSGGRPDKSNGATPQQTGGVNFGTASTVQVYGDIVGGDKAADKKAEMLRERGEELHGIIDKWLKHLAGHYLRRTSVMQGRLTYNQCLDLDIAEGNPSYDFGRIELLIHVYFPSLRPAYDRVIEARTALNRIDRVHKSAYAEGDTDGAPFLQPFLRAQILVENLGNALKQQLLETIRLLS
jgi:hypothetical protein